MYFKFRFIYLNVFQISSVYNLSDGKFGLCVNSSGNKELAMQQFINDLDKYSVRTKVSYYFGDYGQRVFTSEACQCTLGPNFMQTLPKITDTRNFIFQLQ